MGGWGVAWGAGLPAAPWAAHPGRGAVCPRDPPLPALCSAPRATLRPAGRRACPRPDPPLGDPPLDENEAAETKLTNGKSLTAKDKTAYIRAPLEGPTALEAPVQDPVQEAVAAAEAAAAAAIAAAVTTEGGCLATHRQRRGTI